MRILINARFLLSEKLEGIGLYTYELVRRWVKDHPEDRFVLCFDRPFDDRFLFGENVEPIILRPPARHPLLFIWWFEIGIPKVYRAKKCDVFFSPDGFLSLSQTVTKSLLVIHDLAYLHYPQHLGKWMLWYYQQFIPRFVTKASHIITVSKSSREDIIQHFPETSGKISAVYNGVRDDLQPITEDKQISIRKQYSNGSPYFFSLGAIHPRKNLVGVLKAFQIFKSQSNTDTKLLIAGRFAWKVNDLKEHLVNHRFKRDIILLGYIPDKLLGQLLGASLGLIYISHLEGFGLPITEAMACGTPVITSNLSSMAEIAGDAAVLVAPDDHQEIADGMSRLQRDPVFADDLVERGLKRYKMFDWDRAAITTYDILRRL